MGNERTYEERLARVKEQGYRLVKHPMERDPRQCVWELMTRDQVTPRYSGVGAMAHETEDDIWKHLFTHYKWLGNS